MNAQVSPQGDVLHILKRRLESHAPADKQRGHAPKEQASGQVSACESLRYQGQGERQAGSTGAGTSVRKITCLLSNK